MQLDLKHKGHYLEMRKKDMVYEGNNSVVCIGICLDTHEVV